MNNNRAEWLGLSGVLHEGVTCVASSSTTTWQPGNGSTSGTCITSLSSQVALMLCGKHDTAAKGRRPSLPRRCHETDRDRDSRNCDVEQQGKDHLPSIRRVSRYLIVLTRAEDGFREAQVFCACLRSWLLRTWQTSHDHRLPVFAEGLLN